MVGFSSRDDVTTGCAILVRSVRFSTFRLSFRAVGTVRGTVLFKSFSVLQCKRFTYGTVMHYDAKQFLRDRFARIIRGTVVRDDTYPQTTVIVVSAPLPRAGGGRG